MYKSLPKTFEEARPVLEQIFQEDAATSSSTGRAGKAPFPPRGLQYIPGTLEVLLTWVPPQKASDVAGYVIYQDTEQNRILSINDPRTLQARIKVPANTNIAFWVASRNARGIASRKEQIIAKANTDQVVVSGTGGGTAGTAAAQAPDRVEYIASVEDGNWENYGG